MRFLVEMGRVSQKICLDVVLAGMILGDREAGRWNGWDIIQEMIDNGKAVWPSRMDDWMDKGKRAV